MCHDLLRFSLRSGDLLLSLISSITFQLNSLLIQMRIETVSVSLFVLFRSSCSIDSHSFLFLMEFTFINKRKFTYSHCSAGGMFMSSPSPPTVAVTRQPHHYTNTIQTQQNYPIPIPIDTQHLFRARADSDALSSPPSFTVGSQGGWSRHRVSLLAAIISSCSPGCT